MEEVAEVGNPSETQRKKDIESILAVTKDVSGDYLEKLLHRYEKN